MSQVPSMRKSTCLCRSINGRPLCRKLQAVVTSSGCSLKWGTGILAEGWVCSSLCSVFVCESYTSDNSPSTSYIASFVLKCGAETLTLFYQRTNTFFLCSILVLQTHIIFCFFFANHLLPS